MTNDLGSIFMSWLFGQSIQEEFDTMFDDSFIRYFKDNPDGYDEAMKLLDEVQVPEDLKATAKERFNRIYEQSKKGNDEREATQVQD